MSLANLIANTQLRRRGLGAEKNIFPKKVQPLRTYRSSCDMEKVVLMLFDYGNQVRETKFQVTREFAQKYQLTDVSSAIKNTEWAKRLAEQEICSRA